MNEILETVVSNVSGPVTELITEVLTIAIAGLATLVLNTLREKLNLDTDEKKFADVYGSIQGVVKSINESIVDDIKEKSADGKLTAEEKAEILESAKGEIALMLSEKQRNYITKKYGSYDKAVEMLIHRALFDIKHDSSGNKRSAATMLTTLLENDTEMMDTENTEDVESEELYSDELSECLGAEDEE